MTLKEFAKMLNGREYGNEITKAEEQLAKKLGFAVVFGSSDDLMELRGAIDDEFDCFTGGVFKHNSLPAPIEAVWCPPESECSWVYNTTLSHECFYVYEDEQLYCIGIVCDVNTKPKPMTNADRIRAMSEEELAEAIVSNTNVGACVDFGIPNNKPCCGNCRKCDVVLDWLKQPIGEET